MKKLLLAFALLSISTGCTKAIASNASSPIVALVDDGLHQPRLYKVTVANDTYIVFCEETCIRVN